MNHMQALSESVGKQLEFNRQKEGNEETVATEQFVTMDRFFDAFNVRALDEGRRTRKPMLDPYWTGKDWRFEVC